MLPSTGARKIMIAGAMRKRVSSWKALFVAPACTSSGACADNTLKSAIGGDAVVELARQFGKDTTRAFSGAADDKSSEDTASLRAALEKLESAVVSLTAPPEEESGAAAAGAAGANAQALPQVQRMPFLLAVMRSLGDTRRGHGRRS